MNKLSGIYLILFAVIIAAHAVTITVKYKNLQNGAGKAMGIVTNVTTDRKTGSTGRSYIVRKAYISYEVNGEPHSAAISLANKAVQAGDKMPVLYDKNNPDKVLNTPASVTTYYFLATIVFLIGLSIIVWKRND